MENQVATLSLEYKVDFNNGNRKREIKKQAVVHKAPQIPRIAKLLALAHHLQDLLNRGVVKDYADIARLSGLSRARVTQIMNLTLLAPKIQEEILTSSSPITQKKSCLKSLLKTPPWQEQLKAWEAIKNSLPKN